MLRNGLVGNISRIQLELNSTCNLNDLESKLSANKTLKEVANLKVKTGWPSLPKWVKRNTQIQPIQTHQHLSKSEFEKRVLNRMVDNQTGLVFVDLCELEDRTKHVVVSMHHVLFDHQGMMNFLQLSFRQFNLNSALS